jgi:hypothetical protein
VSTFEDHSYRWRETYFVLFDAEHRPTVTQMERALTGLNDRFDLVNLQADDEGRFESVTVKAHEDGAALDICYSEGDEVIDEGRQLVEDLSSQASAAELSRIKKMAKSNARFDVLHFQEMSVPDENDEADDLFDPSALLVVLDMLVDLTQGVAVDPQSGTMV